MAVLYFGVSLEGEDALLWHAVAKEKKRAISQIEELIELEREGLLYVGKKIEKILPLASLEDLEAHLKSLLMQMAPFQLTMLPEAKLFAID
jgi:hypothetical protein